MDNINWELSEQTDTIGDLVCQIPYTNFGNRNWKAYCNPEIPISDGPYKFSGLPGLIVRIVDGKGHWDFTLSSIESGRSSSQPFSRHSSP
ncbi:MAG: GLPGLI family protein [Sphingobacterium sp.]